MPPSIRAKPLLILLMAAASVCSGQRPSVAAGGYAVFSKVETSSVPSGLDLTVVCTKPVEPGFTRLSDPERLVIDLPDTLVGNHPQSVAINGADVRAMRINQFQKRPPVTRIVLDLMGDRAYTYEPNGASFVVHLRGAQTAATKPSQPAAVVEGATSIGLPVKKEAGAVILAGNRVAPGSAITAGGETAIMRLERGGEIRICPGTTASITPSANGHNVMTGMSEGAVELHYSLTSSADTVLTPDFRILLPGPGEFHYAISADAKGNTCVRALQGNTASAVVSELMGDGTYQVKPGEQVVFHSGRLAHTDANVPLECGCPPPKPAATPPSLADPGLPKPNLPLAAEASGSNPPAAAKAQVVVDAPFVFRGSDLPPNVDRQVTELSTSAPAHPPALPGVAEPRKAKKVKAKKGNAASPEAAKLGQPEPASAPNSSGPAPENASSATKPTQPTTFLGKVKRFFRSIFK